MVFLAQSSVRSLLLSPPHQIMRGTSAAFSVLVAALGGASASRNVAATAATANMASTSGEQACLMAPEVKQQYSVLNNTKISSDSNILTVAFQGREYLGWDPYIPTCISVTYQGDGNEEATDDGSPKKPLAKSYSPISHPSQKDTFELLVKAYPFQPGGGVGAYLCGLQPGDSFEGKLKSQRIMHSSPEVLGRWSHVGLVAGGTGIAPLYQILMILLRDDTTKISILSINCSEQDILLKQEMDELAERYSDRVSVTYSLTSEAKPGYSAGRGDVALVQKALPDPSLKDKVMIFVCGKDGFVETWGGKVEREKTTDGSKGKKIQGPLLGILRDAGYDASQVFKY